jgi:hypothetical protein
MHGCAVGIGENRNGAYPHFPAGAYNPHRNFTAVGNQNFFYFP